MTDETTQTTGTQTPDSAPGSEFAAEAEGDSPGIAREFLDFLRYNKKWWLTPIIVVLVLVGLLVVGGGSAAAPFIYTLF